jgi:hypothetical protein
MSTHPSLTLFHHIYQLRFQGRTLRLTQFCLPTRNMYKVLVLLMEEGSGGSLKSTVVDRIKVPISEVEKKEIDATTASDTTPVAAANTPHLSLRATAAAVAASAAASKDSLKLGRMERRVQETSPRCALWFHLCERIFPYDCTLLLCLLLLLSSSSSMGVIMTLMTHRRNGLRTTSVGGPLFGLRPRDVMRVACDLSKGLNVLHSAGLVHGRVKPSSVYLTHQVRGWGGGTWTVKA